MAVQAWQTYGCYINMDSSQRELNPHGTSDFPVACYLETILSGDGQCVPRHWHADLEFLAVVSGRCTFEADGYRGDLEAGDAVFFNRECRHAVAGAPEARFASVVFSPVIVAGMPDSVFAHRYLAPLFADDAPAYVTFDAAGRFDVAAQVQRAVEVSHGELPGYEFAVRDALSHCVYAAWECMGRPAAAGDADATAEAGRLNRMCMYVRDHLGEHFSVADIAAVANISERECLRTFKKSMGVSPVRYVTLSRLSRAAALLACDVDKPVADIAAESGFTSPGYFSKLFRHEYGCTPREYRAQMHGAGVRADAVMCGYPLAFKQAPAEASGLADAHPAATHDAELSDVRPSAPDAPDADSKGGGSCRPAVCIADDELIGSALPETSAVLGTGTAPHVPDDALGRALGPETTGEGTIG